MILSAKKYFPRSLFIISVIMGVQTATAATYYVSPNGSANWNNCTNINTPCPPVVSMANARAGDIVYFRGGQYELSYDLSIDESYYWYKGVLNPSHSGTSGSPITFVAYPGETPVMNCHTDTRFKDNCRAFGSQQDYIVFDGFFFEADNGLKLGGLIIAGDDRGNGDIRNLGNIIKNITINGGSTLIPTDDNREALRVEKTSGTLIQNCKIFNVRAAPNVIGLDNIAGIKFYHNDHLTVENCEVYNTTTAFSSKSDTDDSIFRYNYIHDNEQGMFFATYTPDISSDRNRVYDNVLVNNSSVAFFQYSDTNGSFHANDWQVYNNTVYGTGSGMIYGLGTNWKFWNNIMQVSGDTQFFGIRNAQLAESDHNQFGNAAFLIRTKVYAGGSNYTSLAAWQTSGELMGGGNPGMGSLASDTKFINSSGNMNQLADFKLAPDSPSKGTGRAGADMGANIGNVGYKGNGIVKPTPPVLQVN